MEVTKRGMLGAVYIVYAVLSGILCVTGVVLNILVCLVFYNNKRCLTPPNIFIVSVAISDLLFSVTCLPLLTITNVYGRWIYGAIGCQLTGFVSTLCGLASIVHLAAGAHERYVALVHPLKKSKVFTVRKTIYYSLALWAYALFWSATPLCGWSGFQQEGVGTSCSVRWQSRATVDLSYNISLITGCFMLPVCIMAFSYSKCCGEICKSTKRAKSTWGKCSPYTRKTLEMERKMVVLFGVMTTAFLVAWTPYAVVSVTYMIGGPYVISDFVASVPAYFAKLSACVNPIVYVLMYRRLRLQVFSLIRRTSSSSRRHSRETAELRYLGT